MSREWSPEQSGVFDWFVGGEGNLVTRARAGTGKTTTIIEGATRSLVKRPSRKMLLAAFNSSIAKELTSRVRDPRIEAKTLHGLGFKYLQRNWRVQVDKNGGRAFALAREVEPNAPPPIIKLIKALHTKARDINPFILETRDVAMLQAFVEQFDLVPDEEYEKRGWTVDRICDAALRAMQLATKRTDVIDFADMIFLPLIHRWVRAWFDDVVIDEAQDMTVAQLTLATGACRRGGRVCVVGDDRQAIYGFRGADTESIDRLKAALGARELGLTTTYRCGKRIVELAAQIVPDFRAHESNPDGEISSLGWDKAIAEIREGDFVLSRKNAPLVSACMALLRRGVRARIKGRDIGQAVVVLVNKLGGDVDSMPARLTEWVHRESERARKNLPEEAADERIALVVDQAAIVRTLLEDATSIDDLVRRCNELFSEDDDADQDRPPWERMSVMCSSVHRAKGLEADNVFLLRDTFRHGPIEEENIKYVAITRAKKRLVWVEGGR